MPKEKGISRKKHGTDVSDALFHVTPQPSIDIFEALGGAINVQTAAFLTGKIDSITAPINVLQEEPVEAAGIVEPIKQAELTKTVAPVKTTATKTKKSKQNTSQTASVTPTKHEDPNESSLPVSSTEDAIGSSTSDIDAIHLDNLQSEPSAISSLCEHAISYASSYAIPTSSANSMATSTAISYASFDQQNSIDNSTPTSTPDSMATSIESSIESSIATHPKKDLAEQPQNSIENSTLNAGETTPNILVCPTAQTPKTKPCSITQLTKREEELLQFLRLHHGEVVSYTQILKSLNWRESQRCTARNIIARFENNGIIKRERVLGSRYQGYRFTICQYAEKDAQNIPYPSQNSSMQICQTSIENSTLNLPLELAPHKPQTSIGNSMLTSMPNSTPSYIRKIDRLINLSIWESEQETIIACWPAVAAAGFRSAHLRQLQSIFELQGFEPDTVSLGLRYLDWQLEQGPLTNARGEIIEDPIAYWLSSMRRHGYYSRPKGYVDPLLEAKRLLAEEEQAKLVLQTQLAEVRQQTESLVEDQRCEHLFTELMAQGISHPRWLDFYQALPQMFRQKVDAEGPEALAKKFAMVKALVKELL